MLRATPGADTGQVTLAVCDGIVMISGRVEYRSAARRLVAAARQAEGVIQVDDQLSYDVDDRYPILPTSF